MGLTKSEMKEAIRIAVDQNASDSSLLPNDDDNLSLDEIVGQKMLDAAWWMDGCNGFSASVFTTATSVDIPAELYSAYVYYAAYLVLSVYGDERAQEMLRTARTLLRLNAKSSAAKTVEDDGTGLFGEDLSSDSRDFAEVLSGVGEDDGAAAIGDEVCDIEVGGGEDEMAAAIGGIIPQNHGMVQVMTMRL